MDGMKIELRQLVGKTSTAAGVFDVAQDIDMVMIETEKLGRPIHYGFIGRAAVSKFTALPHYERDFPAAVRKQIEAELSRLVGRDVGCVQAAGIQQPTATRRDEADPGED